MFDINGQFRASIFTNASVIKPATDVTVKLLNMFRDKEFIPGTFHEIAPPNPPQIRTKLGTPDSEWEIRIATHRIDVEKNPIKSKGTNIGSIYNFKNDAMEIFERLIIEFNLNSNRIALNTSGLLRELSAEKMIQIYKSIFTHIPYYDEDIPFEWSTRVAKTDNFNLEENNEPSNVITIISRVNGEMVEGSNRSEIDRIEIQFDINSKPENSDYRFKKNEISKFLDKAIESREIVITQLREKFDV